MTEVEDADRRQWLVGAAGAVVHRGRVLMVRHTYGEGKGRWSLPGGHATHDERLDQTAVREVREEVGVDAEVVDVIALRTQFTARGGAVSVIFRMRPLSGTPLPDGVEVDRVAYFSAAEVEAMGDDELLPIARNPTLAALKGNNGLSEDARFPRKSESDRGFLAGWK